MGNGKLDVTAPTVRSAPSRHPSSSVMVLDLLVLIVTT
jgi:hypothetical protein